MKITIKEITDNENLLGHIVLSCLGKQIKSNGELVEKIREEGFAEVELVVNGKQVSGLGEFINHWQTEVDRFIKKEAKKLFEEKFSDKFSNITELLSDLQNRVEEEIEEMKPDWEKDLDRI